MKCHELIKILENKAPLYLAENWDNPGLLVGRVNRDIKTALIALDVTNDVIDEAINLKADIIITHHPLIFGAIKSVNDLSYTGEKILMLIENGINHYAMHTNLDKAFGGTNDVLANTLRLENIEPLAVDCEQNGLPNGLGRMGTLKNGMTFNDFALFVKTKLNTEFVTITGNKEKIVKKVGLCTGSGFEFIQEAHANKCDVYITADVKFHDAQKALEMGICLIDATHYATENIIVPVLSKYISTLANGVNVIESAVCGQVFYKL